MWQYSFSKYTKEKNIPHLRQKTDTVYLKCGILYIRMIECEILLLSLKTDTIFSSYLPNIFK